MNIILFGPPGVGKSTILGTLKTLGQRAIDLEDVYPSRIRFSIPNCVDNVFIGGADLNPRRHYPNSKKALLYLPQKEYLARRAARDAAIPGKASQAEHRIDDWLENTEYDWVVDVSYRPEHVAKYFIQLMKGAQDHGNK